MKKMMKGFTLVEIMIVVAIIAILAAVAIPNFVRYRKSSQANACISNLKQIQTAYEQAKMAGITVSSVSDLCGPTLYIKVQPLCPQTNTDTYSLPATETDNPTCSNDNDANFPHHLQTVATGS